MQDTMTNKTIIHEKKPHGSLYVAYIQESPETVNPSISSLPVFLFFFFLEFIKCKSVKFTCTSKTSQHPSQYPLRGEIWNWWSAFNETNHRYNPRSAHLRTHSPSSSSYRPRASAAWLVQSWSSSEHVQAPVSYQLKKAPRSNAGQCSHWRRRDRFSLPNNCNWPSLG